MRDQKLWGCLAAMLICVWLGAMDEVRPAGSLASLVGERVATPGTGNELTVKVRNPFSQPANCDLQVGGRSFQMAVNALSDYNVQFHLALPDSAPAGSQMLPVKLKMVTPDGKVLYSEKVELPYFVALPVTSLDKARVIVLNEASQVTELVNEADAPRWGGPADLSAEFRLSVAGKYLQVDAAVRDQDHSTPYDDGVGNWMNDSIEFGIINAAGERFEFIVSGSSGENTLYWCRLSPFNHSIGAQILPLKVWRDEDRTLYSFKVPLKQVNISDDRGTKFRISLVANDNDGGKRVRLMAYGGGPDGKDGDKFEWCVLR